MIDELIKELTSKIKNSLNIDFNPHKGLSQTAAEYLDIPAFDNAVMIGTDLKKDIWVVQAYPRSSVACWIVVGNDLERVLKDINDLIDVDNTSRLNH